MKPNPTSIRVRVASYIMNTQVNKHINKIETQKKKQMKIEQMSDIAYTQDFD